MANRFTNGAKAFGFCDVCGFRFDLKKLKNLVVKTKQTQIKACPQCWTPDQPQLQLGMYEVSDPQAIRDPRPDTNTWYQSGTNGLQTDPTSGTGPLQEGYPGEGSRVIEWGWAPIGGAQGFDTPLTPNALIAQGQTGTVTAGSTGGLTSQIFTTPGTTSWTAPASVTRALAICVGGGGSSYIFIGPGPGSATNGVAGAASSFDSITAGAGGGGLWGGAGGAGGAGTTLSTIVFGGNGGTGGTGGASGAGGGGAGGYAGNGGNGGNADVAGVSSPGQDGAGGAGGGGAYYHPIVDRGGGGGGVGLFGIGANGLGGATTSSAAASGGGGSGGATATTSPVRPDGGLYGAGGGGNTSATIGGGGGGGGGLRWSVVAVTPGNSYTVVVGAGGDAGTGGGSGANGAVAVWYVT